ncbi:MAG: T9SS type A sorting domain-containing protein [Bacteroidetes bacterium]|nr:T9SS type A sorting domain-containing protein [Bacteroidota bacterium]
MEKKLLPNYGRIMIRAFAILIFAFNYTWGQIALRGTATTATSNANTITISKPTGVVAGDIMIANIASSDNNSLQGNDANLSGWTLINGRNFSNNQKRVSILYRVADGTEPTNLVFRVPVGVNITDSSVGGIIAFSGVNPINPFDVAPGTFSQSINTPAIAPGLTTITANTAIVMVGADEFSRTWSAWSATDPGTLNELFDVNNVVSIGAAWAIKTTTGFTGNGTAVLSGNGFINSMLLALRPALPPTITGVAGSPACPGGTVTINGTNLIGATAANVQIGGTPVSSITSNNGTVLTAVVGAGTTGLVTVTTGGGTATSSPAFTVNPSPAVPGDPTAITPGCNPTGVTITQSGAAPGGVTWYWQTAATGTSTVNSADTPWNVNASGTYYIRAYNGTCWSVGSGSVTVVVNNPPVITSQPATPAEMCSGAGTTTLSVASNATTWQWQLNGVNVTNGGVYAGATSANLTITNPAVTHAGSYSVILNGATCAVTSNPVTLTVNPSPAAPGSPTALTPGCNPAGVTITQSGAAPGGVTWYWQTAATGTSTANSADTPWNVNTSGTYYIRAYNGTCWSPGAGSINVVVNNPPVITTQPVTPVAMCSGAGTTTLSVVSNATTWQWQRNGANITNGGVYVGATTSNLTITNPAVANAGTYTVILNGATCAVTSTPVTLAVNLSPAAPGNPTALTPGCNPAGVTITQSGAAPGGVTWYWQTAATGTSTANSANTPWTVNTSGTYYIRAFNGSCWSLSAGSVTVTVNNIINTLATGPSPANNVAGVCYSGSGATTSVSWAAAAGANSYDVYFGAGVLPGTFTNVATNSFSVGALLPNTTYYWRVVPRNTCGPTSGTPVIWSFTTSGGPCYCIPAVQTPNGLYIRSVAILGTMADPPVNNSGAGTNGSGYSNYTNLTSIAQQAQGEGVNVIASTGGNSFGRGTWKAWVDWNNDGDFTDVGEEVYNIYGWVGAVANFGFTVPATQVPGNYRMRIRVNNGFPEPSTIDFSPCDNFTGFTGYGEAEDYLIKVISNCSSKITTVTPGSECYVAGGTQVTLAAAASQAVTEFRWYTSATGPAYTASLPDGTGLATSFTTPLLSATTIYYVTAVGGCESTFRVPVTAVIKPTPEISFTPTALEICGETAVVAVSATGSKEIVHLVKEDFEVFNSLGKFTNNNVDLNNATLDNLTKFQNKISVFERSADANVWFPAISSGFGGNKFVLATSDVSYLQPPNKIIPTSPVENSLTLTTSVSTVGLDNLTLKLRIYYSRYWANNTNPAANEEYVAIEVSTNGGISYPNLVTKLISNQGLGSNFATLTYDLSGYIGQPNLKFRIRHYSWAMGGPFGGFLPDGVAVDDIELYGERPLQPSFVWTSANPIGVYTDAAGTTPYTPGIPIQTVYFRPDPTQMENYSNWNVTATATLTNSCNAQGTISIVNNSKVWRNAPASTDWNTLNWKPSPAVPTSDKCVVVKTPVIIPAAVDAVAKNIKVENTGKLTVLSGASLTVSDEVANLGAAANVIIQSNANLVQINNAAANTGEAVVFRDSKMKRLDYIYWGTPVFGQPLGVFSPGTVYSRFYSYNEVDDSFSTIAPLTQAMVAGKGYVIRAPNAFDASTPQTFTGIFTGKPNNGFVDVTVTKLGAGKNLLGNPYPSNLKLDQFTADNSAVAAGVYYFWTNFNDFIDNTTTPNGEYGNYASNHYASYTVGTGGVAAANSTVLPTGTIKPGQGFLFVAKAPGGIVRFRNEARTKDSNASPFFSNRMGDGKAAVHAEKYWLKLTAPTNNFNTLLIGYIEGATNSFEPLYDADYPVASSDRFYSVNGDHQLIIQGRQYPFENTDVVPLGMSHFVAGTYKIELVGKEGLFANGQAVYLKDRMTGIITDLSAGNYSYTAVAGESTGRFEIIYSPQSVLATDGNTPEEVQVYRDGTDFVVKAAGNKVTALEIFDTSGKLIYRLEPNSNEVRIDAQPWVSGVYILKITRDRVVINRKVMK